MQSSANMLVTSISLLDAIIATEQARRLATDEFDVYEESLIAAIAAMMEFTSALLFHLSLVQASLNEPFFDFGDEPYCKQDALSGLADFLGKALMLLRAKQEEPDISCSFLSIAVRAQTLSLLLINHEGSVK